MFGLGVLGEGMGRGNGESMTANGMIMTRRPTNVTETNQYPLFVAYCISTHVPICLEAHFHTTEQHRRSPVCACAHRNDNMRCFVHQH